MTRPSRLEIFPDELILDLFSYIPPHELYHVWYGLNQRLNAILRSVRISLDWMENSIQNNQLLNYFSKQIVYIHLYISNSSFNFKQFPNLRSVVIDVELTEDQIDCLHPKFLPHLQRLKFSDWWTINEPLNNIIFRQKSSWLKVYHLPSILNYFSRTTSNLSHIQTMIFDRVTSYDTHLILTCLPTLRRFKVTIIPSTFDDNITKNLLPNPNYQHKSLIDLDITINTCNKLDSLYPLLSHLTALRYLYVACDSLTVNDFQQLALELSTQVPRLERFKCTFKQTFIQDINQLHSINPLFRHMICKKIEWLGGWHYYCVTTEDGTCR